MTTSYSNQLNAVLDKLDEQTAGATANKMLIAITAAQQADVDEYPSATSANRPPGNNDYSWYVRGFGTRTRTGRSYATSEQFGQRWRAVKKTNFRRDLENNASYAGYLMGDKQVGWAKSVGWKDMKQVLDDNSDKYRKLAARVLAKVNRE